MSWRILTGKSSLVLTGVFVMLVTLAATRYLISQSEARVRPFTATVESKMYALNGEMRSGELFTYAAKSDGSSVEIHQRTAPGGVAYATKHVLDLSKRTEVIADGATDSTTTTRISDGQMASLRDKLVSCVGTGRQEGTILGQRTVRTQVVPLNTASKVHSQDYWQAPELGCYVMKLTGTMTSGGQTARSTLEVVELRLGDPDAKLFSIPSTYVERGPRARVEEFERRYRVSYGPHPDRLTKVERAYQRDKQ